MNERNATVLRLRGEGLLYREIAERVGISISTVAEIVTDPDRARARERRQRYGGTCEVCGAPTDGSQGRGKAPRRCWRHGGISTERARRALRMVNLRVRHEWPNWRIARQLDTTPATVASELSRMRALGYEVPYDWNVRGRAYAGGGEKHDRETEGLALGLRLIGKEVPRDAGQDR